MTYVGYDETVSSKIIVVCGPTAVGKSAWAIEKSKAIGGEIISADAYQVYRGMDIGTAKVSLAEQESVPHHLIDCLDPEEGYSVVDFLRRLGPLIQEIRSRGRCPILCGGTAFYLNAFLYGYDLSESPDNAPLQQSLLNRLEIEGLEPLVAELLAAEPGCKDWMDLSNPRRVVRALVQIASGISPTEAANQRLPLRQDVDLVCLRLPRALLVDRINQRVDVMIATGLVAEVQALIDRGVPSDCPAFQGIGYKEVVDYLSGRLELNDMVDCIKVKTRQFAKRQMTWFRRFEQVTWYDMA